MKPQLTEEHMRLLARCMAGVATRTQLKRCMELDAAHVAACKVCGPATPEAEAAHD